MLEELQGLYTETYFLNASMVSANKEELTLNDITEIFNKGINAITVLGKSKEGKKTMLDTLCPALNAVKQNIDNIEDFKNKVLISPRKRNEIHYRDDSY